MKKFFIFMVSLFLILIVSSCKNEVKEISEFIRLDNGEYIDINIYSNDASEDDIIQLKNIVNHNIKLFDHVNIYDDIENIASLNKNRTATLPTELIDTLILCNETYESLNTASIYYGTLKDLWDYHMITAQLPTEEECLAELDVSKATHISFNSGVASLQGNGIIDIDFLLHGYTCNEIKDYLQEHNYDRYVINYNGMTVLYGKNQNGSYFESGFYGMKNGVYKISDTSFSSIAADTVGVFFTPDGRRWADVPSYRTGIPRDYFEVIFVMGENPVMNSILSQAFYNLTLEEVMEAEIKYNVKAIGYRDRNQVYRNNYFESILV